MRRHDKDQAAMLDTILLLTGETERPVLAETLGRCEPGIRVWAGGRVADLPHDLSNARLIAFLFPDIVPPEVLSRLGYGAYNVHPGPPDYPGWMPAAFALHDGATSFGATLHEMAAKVDSGIICDVESFSIPVGCRLQTLEELTYAASLRLFQRWVEALVSPLRPPRLPLAWGSRKCTRKGLAALGPPLTKGLDN